MELPEVAVVDGVHVEKLDNVAAAVEVVVTGVVAYGVVEMGGDVSQRFVEVCLQTLDRAQLRICVDRRRKFSSRCPHQTVPSQRAWPPLRQLFLAPITPYDGLPSIVVSIINGALVTFSSTQKEFTKIW